MTHERKTENEWQTTTVGEFAPFIYGKSLTASKRNPEGQVPVFGSNGIVGWHDTAWTDGPTVIIGRKGTIGAVHYSPVPCWPIDTTFFCWQRRHARQIQVLCPQGSRFGVHELG